ncbi:dihydrofolate reductase [Arthrobacter sp. UYP6]|uniref:dihydrofolate reductase family protein n=1 Tax=Arthrobacter sp. UYP6 TaxID=1756378 RepID=UPI0033975F4E
MTLSVNAYLSLDGVMQGPGAADEDRSGGFANGGWLVPHLEDPEVGRTIGGWFTRADSLLLGRNTYDSIQPFWEPVTDPEDAVAYALNHLPKYLVTSSAVLAPWHNTRVLSGEPTAAIAALKEYRGDMQVHGSHRLAQALHNAGMVDEFRLLVLPVIVGSGKRLFDSSSMPTGLELLAAETLPGGAQYLRFRPIPFGTTDIAPRGGESAEGGTAWS